jgi:hypothetical protein
MAVEIVDDKSEHCIPFILDKIKAHHDYHGIQGAGKTTLVSGSISTKEHASQSLFLWAVRLLAFLRDHTQCHIEHNI